MNKMLVVTVLSLALALIGCTSLPGIKIRKGNINKNAKEMMKDAVDQTNYLVVVSVIGCSLSVAAIVYGVGKFGIAGLAGSFTCLVMSLATIRYAWVFAILGVASGILVLLNGYIKNRKTIHGFIEGFQKAKYNRDEPKEYKEEMNKIMKEHLTPEGEKYVKSFKRKQRTRGN